MIRQLENVDDVIEAERSSRKALTLRGHADYCIESSLPYRRYTRTQRLPSGMPIFMS